ncbi:hypothetical protein ACKWTF_014670 [Chironomus riparius]
MTMSCGMQQKPSIVEEKVEEIFTKSKTSINGTIGPRKEPEEIFKCSEENLLRTDSYSKWYKETYKLGVNVVVRKITDLTKENEIKISNEIKLNIKLANQHVSSILKFYKINTGYECVYVIYESCQSTIDKFMKENADKLSKKEFSDLIIGIMKTFGNLHNNNKIILNEVLSENMAYCLENGELKFKMLNLTEAEDVSEQASKCYKNDIKQFGKLLFSIVTKAEEVEESYDHNASLGTFDGIKDFINTKLKDLKCIESFKKESFADLIASMMENKESSILNYLDYSFFWDTPKIEECFKVTNSWIYKKNKDMENKFNEEFKYENWKDKITESVIKQEITRGYGNTGAEMIRFMRNRIGHSKDYKDKCGRYFYENELEPCEYFFEIFPELFYKLSKFYIENELYVPHKQDFKPKPNQEKFQQSSSSSAPHGNSASYNNKLRIEHIALQKMSKFENKKQ